MCTCGHAENVHTMQVCAALGCRCISYQNRWTSRPTVTLLRDTRERDRSAIRKP